MSLGVARLRAEVEAAAQPTSQVIRRAASELQMVAEKVFATPEGQALFALCSELRQRAGLLEGCREQANQPQSNTPLFDAALVSVLTCIGEVRS